MAEAQGSPETGLERELPLAAARERLKALERAAKPPRPRKPRLKKRRPVSVPEPEPPDDGFDDGPPADEPEPTVGLTTTDHEWVRAVVAQIKARVRGPRETSTPEIF